MRISYPRAKDSDLHIIWNAARLSDSKYCLLQPRALAEIPSTSLLCENPVETSTSIKSATKARSTITEIKTTLSSTYMSAVTRTTPLSLKRKLTKYTALTVLSSSSMAHAMSSSSASKVSSKGPSRSHGSMKTEQKTSSHLQAPSTTIRMTTLETVLSVDEIARESDSPNSLATLLKYCSIIIRQLVQSDPGIGHIGLRHDNVVQITINIVRKAFRPNKKTFEREFRDVDIGSSLVALTEASLSYPVIVDFSAEKSKDKGMKNWLVKIHAGPFNWDLTYVKDGLPQCEKFSDWPVSVSTSFT